MKTHTIRWLVTGAVGAGMLVLATGANAAGTSGTTGINVSQPVPSQHLQLAAAKCGGIVKASASGDAMKDDKMASDAMKTDKMAKDDKMADDTMASDTMKTDKMAKDEMKTDVMADATDCADKDTMKN